MVHRRPVYIYLFNVPSFSSRHFNKIKRTSRLGRLLALSLEILVRPIYTGLKMEHTFHEKNVLHTGKCIRRSAGIYAYCRYFIDRKW